MEAPGPSALAQAREAAVQSCHLRHVVSQGPSGCPGWARSQVPIGEKQRHPPATAVGCGGTRGDTRRASSLQPPTQNGSSHPETRL